MSYRSWHGYLRIGEFGVDRAPTPRDEDPAVIDQLEADARSGVLDTMDLLRGLVLAARRQLMLAGERGRPRELQDAMKFFDAARRFAGVVPLLPHTVAALLKPAHEDLAGLITGAAPPITKTPPLRGAADRRGEVP